MELMRSKVDTADVFWIDRFSIDVNVGVVVPPVNVAVRVSVPPAPLSVSAEPNVAKVPLEPPKEPSNESLPEEPVKVFALVVSGQVKCRRKSLIKKRFCYF